MTRISRRLPIAALATSALVLGVPAVSSGEATAPAPAPVETTSATAPTQAAPTQTSTTVETTPTQPPVEAVTPPQVRSKQLQGSSPSGKKAGAHAKRGAGEGANTPGGAARAKQNANGPGSISTLTPPLPSALLSPFGGLPSFFIESFQIPPFLLPIFQAAGTAYGVPWQVLAAINEVETDYGRDLSLSSAGAEGWMQFLPSEWSRYGVDANGDGWQDPYNPADAIFAAARYLRAAGGAGNVKAAVYAYNHSQAYVESVMLRARLLDGTPPELLGAITGLTEARFPVYAPSHFSDGFPTVAAASHTKTLVGTTIYSQPGAPVIAVQDGEIVGVGSTPSLGRYIELRDAYGNTYVYADLGDVASVYPVLQPRVHSALSKRLAKARVDSSAEPPPGGPATAGEQPRSPLSEQATISALSLGAAAGLESIPVAPARRIPPHAHAPHKPKPPAQVQSFAEGSNQVYLHPLVTGVQVIAGTVLGHVAATADASAGEAPHIVFQIRPAGTDAPLIDPKPLLDGWVALEGTSIFRAKGENPFLATSPTVGQVLLESQQQLQPQVLHDGAIHLSSCARQDVQEGRVDKRVLAALEYLSVSGLAPTVSGLPCAPQASAASAANASAGDTSRSVRITAVNGTPISGHEGPGSIADQTVRKLLMLQGLARPRHIVSDMSYPGVTVAVTSSRAAGSIHVGFAALGARGARAAALAATQLSPSEWIQLIDRLGEIPDPTVAGGHSSTAIADPPGASAQATETEERSSGNG